LSPDLYERQLATARTLIALLREGTAFLADLLDCAARITPEGHSPAWLHDLERATVHLRDARREAMRRAVPRRADR
jgi:hypothetical protein